jgi:hypothetical protein
MSLSLPPHDARQRAGTVALCERVRELVGAFAIAAGDGLLPEAGGDEGTACGARAGEEVLFFGLIAGGLLLPL